MSEPDLIDRPALAPRADAASGPELLFARHGATAMNLAGQRCGGDIDPPLTDTGRAQARQLARAVAALAQPPVLVITSDLLRTRETARIVCDALPGAELLEMPALRERSLGFWNLEPIEATEAALMRGDVPPGGESADAFRQRIEGAVQALRPHLHRRVLVVASKGVGRVLNHCTGQPARAPLGNAELLAMRLPAAASGNAA